MQVDHRWPAAREINKGTNKPRAESDVTNLQRFLCQECRFYNRKESKPAENEGRDWKAKLPEGANRGLTTRGARVAAWPICPALSLTQDWEHHPPPPPQGAQRHLEVSFSSANRR